MSQVPSPEPDVSAEAELRRRGLSPWSDGKLARRRLIVGGAWNALGSLVATVFGPLVTVIVIRSMSPATYGSYAVALAAASLLAPVAGFGLAGAVGRIAGAEVAVDGPEVLPTVRRACTVIARRCFSGAAVLIGLLSMAMLRIPSMRADLVPFLILAPMVLSAPWDQAAQGMLQATFKPKIVFGGMAVTNVATFCLTLAVFAMAHGSVVSVAAARTAGSLLGSFTFLVGARWWALHDRGSPGTRSVDSYARDLARLGSAVLLALVLSIAISQLDVLVLGAFKGSAKAGEYSPASRLADFAIMAAALMGSYLLPALGAALARDDRDGAIRLYHWASRWAIVLTAPAIGTMVAAPSALIGFLFGVSPIDAAPSRMLAIGVTANCVLGLNGFMMVAYAETRALVVISVCALTLSVTSCFVLIPMYGALGAGIATSTPLLGVNIAASIVLARRHQVPAWDGALYYTVAALAAGLLGAVVLAHVFASSGVAVVAVAAASSLAPTLIVAALAGYHEDRAVLMELSGRSDP